MKHYAVLFCVFIGLYNISYAQTDSVWILNHWKSYINALRADSTDAVQARINSTIEGFQSPLSHAFDVDEVNGMRHKIVLMFSDSTDILSAAQSQRIKDIDLLLASYEEEASRMIKAFHISDIALRKKIEDYTSPDYDNIMVSAFCNRQFSEWVTASHLLDYSDSKIPYLRQLALELKSWLADLCDEQRASPDLLRLFLDQEYRISCDHIKSSNYDPTSP